jgi:DNA-binding response OmpR family regulator
MCIFHAAPDLNYNSSFLLGGIPLLTSNHGGVEAPRADLRGVHVLVVEDHWHVAHALKLLLEAEGMEVNGLAATIADAHRLVTEHKPALAVVDINLKFETTYGLIDQLGDQGVRVVVVSGYAVLPGLTEKVAAVLQKPFIGSELLAALRRALSH